MKQKSLKLAIMLAVSSTCLPALADVTLYDYTEATSAYEDAYLSANANISRSRNDSQTAYDMKLDVNLDKVLSSPNRDTTFKLDANGLVSRAGTAGAKSTDSYTVGLSATMDNYFTPGSKGAFWYGSGSVRANSASDDLETKLGLGLGYGRVVNVTPMAKAIRLVDSLSAQGSIKGKPSKAAYNQIANIIAKEDEYASKFGRKTYQQHWLGDIEGALRSSGVISGNLNAAGVLEARRVMVDERISTRKLGWKVRAGLSYIGTNFDGLTNKPGLELGAEYHQPLSNQTQLSSVAVATAILDNATDAYNFTNKVSLTHEIDDRIDWENSWVLDYNKAENGNDITTNTLSSTFLYELTNSLDYSITANISDTDGTANDGTDRSLLMGIRYRLK